MARGGHRQAEGVSQIADTQLIVGQRMHEAQPSGIGQGLEDVYGISDDIGGRQPNAGCLDLGGVYNGGQRGYFHNCKSIHMAGDFVKRRPRNRLSFGSA